MDTQAVQLSLQKPELVREWERKFLVPLSADIGSLVNQAVRIAEENGWNMMPREESNRIVRYLDVERHILALRNQTIREVTRLDASGKPKSTRYDYKTGSRKRFEASLAVPNDVRLSADEIHSYIPDGFYRDGESGLYKPLKFVADARTHHIKIGMRKYGILLETKFDHFKVKGGGEFREMEIELKSNDGIKGSKPALKELVELFDSRLSKEYSLVPYPSQKYNHVLISLRGSVK